MENNQKRDEKTQNLSGKGSTNKGIAKKRFSITSVTRMKLEDVVSTFTSNKRAQFRTFDDLVKDEVELMLSKNLNQNNQQPSISKKPRILRKPTIKTKKINSVTINQKPEPCSVQLINGTAGTQMSISPSNESGVEMQYCENYLSNTMQLASLADLPAAFSQNIIISELPASFNPIFISELPASLNQNIVTSSSSGDIEVVTPEETSVIDLPSVDSFSFPASDYQHDPISGDNDNEAVTTCETSDSAIPLPLPSTEVLFSTPTETNSVSTPIVEQKVFKQFPNIIVNQDPSNSNPLKDAIGEGFFTKLPDKDNPGKFISYYVIPTKSSVTDAIANARKSDAEKGILPYLLEPLPLPDFEVPVNGDTPEGKVAKKMCMDKFSSRLLLQKHLKALVADPEHQLNFFCKSCGIRYVTQTSLHAHISSQHKDESLFECLLCMESFVTRRQWENHTNKVHPENNICEICGKVYSKHGHLITHLAQHPKLKCEICVKQFKYTQMAMYTYHMNRHYRKEKLRKSLFDQPRKPWCSICSIGLESKKHLKLHNLIRHKELKKEEPVDPCF